ncbi:hypothetical protein [Arthrobacter sp.]|uniref:hypothetical protein n=1 Tax=Arthrobacter sp. TaxID=1667 RepID=UPI003390797C
MAAEPKTSEKQINKAAADEAAVLSKIAEMPLPDREGGVLLPQRASGQDALLDLRLQRGRESR